MHLLGSFKLLTSLHWGRPCPERDTTLPTRVTFVHLAASTCWSRILEKNILFSPRSGFNHGEHKQSPDPQNQGFEWGVNTQCSQQQKHLGDKVNHSWVGHVIVMQLMSSITRDLPLH